MANDKESKRDKVDQLRPHHFDGIQEYDNALPKWWLWLFYITIVFSPIYLIYYHFGGGTSIQQELKGDLEQVKSTLEPQGNETAVDYLALAKDPAIVATGQDAYRVNCVACHGALGQGGIGPNLTDRFWIHGGSAVAIHKTIAAGVTDKGMPPWLPVLGVEKVNAITAYVLTLKNTQATGGKEAQGTEEKE
jgi:cytochrome c oxidase cbb3-type subunit III